MPRVAMPIGVASALLLGPGCSPDDPTIVGRYRAPVITITPDGTVAITDPGVVVNGYGRLLADAKKGALQLTTDPNELASDLKLKDGDLLMIIQMQGAQMKQPADPKDRTYGAVTSLGGAGLFELIRVSGTPTATTGTIPLDPSCGGLRNDYSVAGKTQIVRVPQYSTLNVQQAGGASIVARPWNGATGGVLAIRSRFDIIINGVERTPSLNANATGFRGGKGDRTAGDQSADQDAYFGAAAVGGEKGEGIAGSQQGYDDMGGRYGRGAPANGGGGGNAFAAGGGGGGGAGDAATWSGHGVMNDSVVNGVLAWPLDPAYKANGNANTTAPGGGRGGYSNATSAQDPTKIEPGAAEWSGNLRRERGGLGGRPLPAMAQVDKDTPPRLFLGGGGGAGDAGAANVDPGTGGAGGGIVYLHALRLSGTGVIGADGGQGLAPLAPGPAPGRAGAGGGGGGGSVWAEVRSTGDVIINANGGQGGSQGSVGPGDADGPGGGGGGGIVATRMGTTRPKAKGTLGGTTSGVIMNQFPANGATQGGDGVLVTLDPALPPPGCFPVDLVVGADNNAVVLTPGAKPVYTVTVANRGPYDAYGVVVKSTTTAPLAMGSAWTCEVAASNVMAGAAGCTPAGGTGNINATLNLPAEGTATFKLTAVVPTGVIGPFKLAVTATAPPDVKELNPADNGYEDVDIIEEGADLSLNMRTDPSPPIRGYPMSYLLFPFNHGTVPAQNVHVKVRLPQGIAPSGQPHGDGWTCAAADGVIDCDRESLPPAANAGPTIEIPVATPADTVIAYFDAEISSDTKELNPLDNLGRISHRFSMNRDATVGGGIGCAAAGSPGGPGGAAALLLPLLALLRRRRR